MVIKIWILSYFKKREQPWARAWASCRRNSWTGSPVQPTRRRSSRRNRSWTWAWTSWRVCPRSGCGSWNSRPSSYRASCWRICWTSCRFSSWTICRASCWTSCWASAQPQVQQLFNNWFLLNYSTPLGFIWLLRHDVSIHRWSKCAIWYAGIPLWGTCEKRPISLYCLGHN